MVEKTRSYSSTQVAGSFSEFEDHQLQATMKNFLEEEEKENPSIWNFATIAGIAMMLVSMVYIIQLITFSVGSGFSEFMGIIAVLGAVMVGYVGFGYFVCDRKRMKKARKKQQERRKDYFDQEFSDKGEQEERFDIESELFGTSAAEQSSQSGPFDVHAFSKSKKLYKSRTNKKVSGVCGGLAKYFGISSNVIRFLFFFALVAGWGAPLLIYIALAFALEKEPPELMDDFDY